MVSKIPDKNDQNKILNDEDIIKKISENEGDSCYNNIDDYPKILGRYSKNNLILIERCFCSDYCPPEYWNILILYENIDSEEKCAEVDGIDITDAAWGGYIGCAPNVAS